MANGSDRSYRLSPSGWDGGYLRSSPHSSIPPPLSFYSCSHPNARSSRFPLTILPHPPYLFIFLPHLYSIHQQCSQALRSPLKTSLETYPECCLQEGSKFSLVRQLRTWSRAR